MFVSINGVFQKRFVDLSTCRQIGTKNLKTKERKCHLTNINAYYIGDYAILSLGDCGR